MKWSMQSKWARLSECGNMRREAVNISAKPGVNEFERAKVKVSKEPGTLVNLPMVQESPVKFEFDCEYHSTIRLPSIPPMGVDVVRLAGGRRSQQTRAF